MIPASLRRGALEARRETARSQESEMSRDSSVPAWALILVLSGIIGACQPGSRSSTDDEAAEPARIDPKIERALQPGATEVGESREGLAAVVLIDVSGSMKREAPGSRESKIVIARRAAVDLVEQFAKYADDHPKMPVELAIFEFSSERPGDDVRPIVPMGRPDRLTAARAIAGMHADGGTPIGDAMVRGKRALDATRLTRRHLLVVTDGENTDGFEPGDVARAMEARPIEERPMLYFVAFDIDARRFNAVKNAGGAVMEAASGKALGETIDTLLRGKILIEK
jgi:Mg-chelatase subunit ChlD